MTNEEWQEFVNHLVEAKRELARAWSILDGIDGATSETEEALRAATDSIDRIYKAEAEHDYNSDVAAPAEVQAFWDAHGQLPGFALGT